MDVTTIVTAVATIVIGVVAAFYLSFKKSAQSDGVENYKDLVVKEVDELATKLEEKSE